MRADAGPAACRSAADREVMQEKAPKERTSTRGDMYIAATPNPRAAKSAERGNQVPGASPAVDPREAQALSAPARQLTPQADERGVFDGQTIHRFWVCCGCAGFGAGRKRHDVPRIGGV